MKTLFTVSLLFFFWNIYSQENSLNKLDSMYYWVINDSSNGWKEDSKVIYSDYDLNGRPLTAIRFNKVDNNWEPNSKTHYKYDINGNVIESLSKQLKDTIWINQSLITDSFNIENKQTYHLVQFWNDSIWENNSVYIYSYIDGKIVNYTYKNSYNNGWIYITQTNYSYDINKNEILKAVNSYKNEVLTSSYKDTSIYNAEGYLKSKLTLNYKNNKWVNSQLDTFSLDSNGYVIFKITKKWVNNVWINDKMNTDYVYDNKNNIIETINNIWLNNAWSKGTKTKNIYDLNGNRISRIYESWKDSVWLTYSKEEYRNDNLNRPIFSSYIRYEDGVNILYGDSTHFYYHEVSNNISLPNNNLNLYTFPNPFQDYFILKSSEPVYNIKILNITGDVVYCTNLKGALQKDIHISNLPAGIYYLETHTSKAILGNKIMKK